MAILEFAMSLHTKRGEADKRKEALQCIWQLELNTNNDEEILKEAANVRKSIFFIDRWHNNYFECCSRLDSCYKVFYKPFQRL